MRKLKQRFNHRVLQSKAAVALAIFSLFFLNGCSDPVEVSALYETPQVISPDDAADDPAIWLNQVVPEQSIILGTDKKSGVYAYNLQGEQIGYTELGKINNIDTRSLDSDTYILASNRTDQTVGLWRFADLAMAKAAAKSDFTAPRTQYPGPVRDQYLRCLYGPGQDIWIAGIYH